MVSCWLWLALMSAVAAQGPSPLTTCECATSPNTTWTWAWATGVSSWITNTENNKCWDLSKTAGTRTCDGYCVTLGKCTATTPMWRATSVGSNNKIVVTSAGPWQGYCLDENTADLYLQVHRLKPC